MEVIRLGENTVHNADFVVDRKNGHPVYLLILIKTPSRFWVSGEWKELPADTAVLFLPGQKHLYGAITDTKENPAYMDDWMHIASSTPILPDSFPFGEPIVLHQKEEFYHLFHNIHQAYFGTASHRGHVLEHLTKALLYQLYDASNTKDYPEIYYSLTRIREGIYQNPEREWNITALAKSLDISEGYFHALYKQFFQVTCIQDVIKSRIELACELLSSTRYPVETISELCGYQNVEHFIRQFRREMNTTPGKYRKSVNL